MRRVLFILACLASAALAAEVWTNRAGRTFQARLLTVDNTGALFVFAEDGVTNSLPLNKLSSECAKRACEKSGYVPIPPKIFATYNRAASDIQRINDLVEDELLTEEKAQTRRNAVFSVFTDVCREKGIDAETISKLIDNLKK